MCARNECDSRNRTRTKKTNIYAHVHVFTKCVTSLLGFMCFVLMLLWILVFTLSLVSDGSPFSRKVLYVNFISPRIRNSKYKVLFFWMLKSDFVQSSSTQSVSQILAYFTSRKRVFLRCCLYTSPSVTIDRRQL